MNLKKGIEELMVAASFAEAGEHETAREILKGGRHTKRTERAPAARRTIAQRKELRTPSIYR
jgi:hypothetical protein